MMVFVSLLGCDAYKVKLWHFRTLLILLNLTAPSLMTFAEAREVFYKGELIDIGTHRLHIHCTGQGSPTVILDSGIGGLSLEWSKIQENLVKNNLKVCSYDRAGYGWSDSGPKPRTTARITKELKTLLTQANIPGPYLLVGHSFGGFNIRYFASEYPKLIAGLILLDSSHPQQFETDEFKTVSSKKLQSTNNISRLRINIIQPVVAKNFPKENKRIARMLMSTNKSLKTLINELENMETSAIQLAKRSNHKPYEFPVIIITRGKRVWPNNALGNRKEQRWTKLQYDLEKISSNSTHFFAYKSGHAVHLDEPKLITEKILLAIEKSRNNIIKNELTKIFTSNLVTYSIISSFNQTLPIKQNIFANLNRMVKDKKYKTQIEWSINTSIAQQDHIRKINTPDEFESFTK